MNAPGKRISWLVMIPIVLPAFMSNIDLTVVNVALPTITRELHGSLSMMQWVIAGYCMAAACLVVFGGALADIFGKRKMLVGCTLVFTLASATAGLAQSSSQLIISRFIQGAGMIAYPIALALASVLFADKHRTLVLSIATAVAGISAALGPTLGGIILEWLGWRWVFFINVPLGLVAVVLTVVWVPEPPLKKERDLDWLGQVLLTAGLLLALLALNKVQDSPAFLAVFVVGVILLIVFFFVERRVAHPVVKPQLLRNRRFAGANATRLLFQYVCLGTVFLVSLYIQNVLLRSPLDAGLTLLWFTGAVGVLAPLMGYLMDRVGTRKPMTLGMMLIAVSCCLMSGNSPTDGIAGFRIPLLIFGIGTAALFPGLTSTALSSVPDTEAGVASGLLNMSARLGGAIGITITGLLLHLKGGGSIVEASGGNHEAFLSGFALNMRVYVVLCIAGAGLIWATGGSEKRRR